MNLPLKKKFCMNIDILLSCMLKENDLKIIFFQF